MKITEHCKKALHIQAVAQTAKNLPEELATQYILDSKKEQKRWQAHKVSNSELLLPKCKGRPTPHRKCGLKPQDSAYGTSFSRVNSGAIHIPQIYGLDKCLNEKEKLILIAKARIDPEVKAELIEFHCKGMMSKV